MTAQSWWMGVGFLICCVIAFASFRKVAQGPPLGLAPIVLPHEVGDVVDWGIAEAAIVPEADPSDAAGDLGYGPEPVSPVIIPTPVEEVPDTPSPKPPVITQRSVDVMIDAGHGGGDPGTSGHGMEEKEFALDIARRLAAELGRRGVEVGMTREVDQWLELPDRVESSREAGARLFVSIHLNAHDDGSVSGAETWYAPRKVLSLAGEVRASFGLEPGEEFSDHRDEEMAKLVQSALIASTGARDRGIRQSRFHVIYHNPVPSVLVECGFLSHAGEAAEIAKSGYRESIAQGIADGVSEMLEATAGDPWFGVEVSVPEETPTGP